MARGSRGGATEQVRPLHTGGRGLTTELVALGALACSAFVFAACSSSGAGPGGAVGVGGTGFSAGEGGDAYVPDGVDLPPPSPGQVVARVEHGAPTLDEYTLRATLPVPRGTFPRSDGKMPFAIDNGDGQLTPCQVEIVSRYPDSNDGADVVELITRTDRPGGVSAGNRVQYDVQFTLSDPAAFQPNAQVNTLLSAAGALQMRTRDVFGHHYTADLYEDARTNGDSLRVLRTGAVARQVATHESLRPTSPVSGASATLPHMMGVHSYVTQWAGEPFLSLDLRIHNGHSGLDNSDTIDDPLGKLYFQSLELRVPSGWVVVSAFDGPLVGQPYNEGAFNVYPIIAPLAGGKMNMMPRMSQMTRRLAVCLAGQEARAEAALNEEYLAFCIDGTAPNNDQLWSWWNPGTARYFPQSHRLPSLDHVGLSSLRNQKAAEFASRRDQLAGTTPFTWPIVTDALGWAHPWGISHGGMVSGSEIYLWDGVDTAAAASTEGYRLYQISHRMYNERQPNVLFNKDGLHTQMPQWLVWQNGQQYLPVWWYNEPMLWAADPFGFDEASTHQIDAVAGLGLKPDYEDQLVSFLAIDEQHLVRYTRSPKVLVWLGNDALARDDIRSQAEGIRFTFSMYAQDAWGGVIPTGMLYQRTYVDAFPGWGFSYGRAEGWGLDTMSAAYSILDETWRSDTRGWFDDVVDLVEDGQSTCLGNIQSTPLWNVFGAQYRCRQSIECAITENALVGMRESVYGVTQPGQMLRINQVLANAIYGMISPTVWSETGHGPWAMIGVGAFDNTQPPYCTWWPNDGNYGIIDGFQTWSSYAYGYEVTGDPIFLTKAEEMLQNELNSGLHSDGTYFLEQRVALLALVQDMN